MEDEAAFLVLNEGVAATGAETGGIEAEQSSRILETDLPEFRFGEEAESGEVVHAVQHAGRGTGEALRFFGGDFPLRIDGDREAEGFIMSGGKSGKRACVAGHDEMGRGFGAQRDFDEIGGKMVAIGDEESHQIVAGQLPPEGIFVAVDQIGASIAQMGREAGTCGDGLFHLRVGCGVVADRGDDPLVGDMANEVQRAGALGGEGQDADMAFRPFLIPIEHGGRWILNEGAGVDADRAGFRGDEGAFEMDAEEVWGKFGIAHSAGEQREDMAVAGGVAGDDGGAICEGAACYEEAGDGSDRLKGQVLGSKRDPQSAVDLQINKTFRGSCAHGNYDSSGRITLPC